MELGGADLVKKLVMFQIDLIHEEKLISPRLTDASWVWCCCQVLRWIWCWVTLLWQLQTSAMKLKNQPGSYSSQSQTKRVPPACKAPAKYKNFLFWILKARFLMMKHDYYSDSSNIFIMSQLLIERTINNFDTQPKLSIKLF